MEGERERVEGRKEGREGSGLRERERGRFDERGRRKKKVCSR